jgi:hypothetical protein
MHLHPASHQLAGNDGFPAPLGKVGRTIVWRWGDLEQWARAKGRTTTRRGDI